MANADSATMLNDDVYIHPDINTFMLLNGVKRIAAMETRPYEPFSFGDCAIVDPIGLIKVNHRNYEALKNSANPQVYYNEKMDALMVDNNLVTIDDELADDLALYNPMFLSTSPPIRPIEPIRLLGIAP